MIHHTSHWTITTRINAVVCGRMVLVSEMHSLKLFSLTHLALRTHCQELSPGRKEVDLEMRTDYKLSRTIYESKPTMSVECGCTNRMRTLTPCSIEYMLGHGYKWYGEDTTGQEQAAA
ncbi:hypothetical protein Tco_1524421 [Tanacetum coccineum]